MDALQKIYNELRSLRSRVHKLICLVNSISGYGTNPTVTVDTNSGTGAVATLSSGSTSTKGKISLTTGTAPVASGLMFTINFNTSYPNSPIPTLTPANDNAGTWQTDYGYYVVITPTVLEVYSTLAPDPETTYEFYYIITP